MKALTLISAVILLCNVCMAQTTTNAGVTARLTKYELKPEYREQFQKVLIAYVQQAIADKSNIMVEAYYEKEYPSVLWLIERWSNYERTGKFSKAIRPLINKSLVKPARIYILKDLEPITREQWRRTAKKKDTPLTVMLFVDAKNGTQQNFKQIYHQAMPKFRGEPGVVTYQLSQIEGDDTQFVTYEKFRSDEAFRYHLKFPPIQPVIDYLNSSIKSPPFQKGIHNLIEFAPLTRE